MERIDGPLLEPPGFMFVNYGRSTVAVTVLLHLACGTIVGGFAAGCRRQGLPEPSRGTPDRKRRR
jgi:hypothetical protein